MDLDLDLPYAYLAYQFARVTPNATSTDIKNFINSCENVSRSRLAQDQALVTNRPQGGTSMPYPNRTGRDQDPIPGANGQMTPRGGMFGTTIDQDPDNPSAAMPPDPEEMANIIRVCANGYAAADDEGLSHNTFMNLLAEILAQAHQNGNGMSGDARKRAARDNGSTGRPTPAGGLSNFTGRGSMDRKRAMDSSIAVRNLNQKSFLQRFPDARKISIRG